MGTQITPAIEMTRKSQQVSERPVSAQVPLVEELVAFGVLAAASPTDLPTFSLTL